MPGRRQYARWDVRELRVRANSMNFSGWASFADIAPQSTVRLDHVSLGWTRAWREAMADYTLTYVTWGSYA
jgi:hypothetical protein